MLIVLDTCSMIGQKKRRKSHCSVAAHACSTYNCSNRAFEKPKRKIYILSLHGTTAGYR